MSEDELIRMRAKVAEATSRVQRMAADFADIGTKIKMLTVTAESRDRLVKVTVGPEGRLAKLELDPDVYDFHSPEELALEIEQTTRAAADEAAQRVMALVTPIVPETQVKAAMAYDYQAVAEGLARGLT